MQILGRFSCLLGHRGRRLRAVARERRRQQRRLFDVTGSGRHVTHRTASHAYGTAQQRDRQPISNPIYTRRAKRGTARCRVGYDAAGPARRDALTRVYSTIMLASRTIAS